MDHEYHTYRMDHRILRTTYVQKLDSGVTDVALTIIDASR
jgi:hypothetical protein